MDRIRQALELGQSFWLDYIRRDLLENGELDRMIQSGEIRGVTSNPAIFQQAIGNSELYNGAMRPLAHAGWSANRIYESLAIHDIRAATDLFLPLYEGTDGRDGFVSIEVNPRLSEDTQATVEEARRLWEVVNRPNLMVKIPATESGIPAIEQSIYEGINVNVTLIFALDRYSEVMDAYLRGLERRQEEGLPLDRSASVASFFVSRVDTAVDRELEALIREEGPHAPRAAALLGSAAVANAKLAYAQFQSVFEDPRFARLAEQGARIQRPLWASTSTKNPGYSDVLYVDELIGRDTVNTLPPKTLDAFRDHGSPEPRLEKDLAVSRAQLEALEALGVSMQEITDRLEAEGVDSFAKSFGELIDAIASRATAMRSELGELQPAVARTLEELDQVRAAARYWRKDLSLWPGTRTAEGARIADYGEKLRDLSNRIEPIADALRTSSSTRVMWIGEVPGSGAAEDLRIETVDPLELRGYDAKHTVVAALSHEKRDPFVRAVVEGLWHRAEAVRESQAAELFLAVAPADSELLNMAEERGFRWVVKDGTLGALLMHAELAASAHAAAIAGAEGMKDSCAPNRKAAMNPGLYLGAVLGVANHAGYDRLWLMADEDQVPQARWLADRLSTSGFGSRANVLTHKPAETGQLDRMLIYLRSSGSQDRVAEAWSEAGEPVLILELDADPGAVGAELVRWDMAAGIAAHLVQCEPEAARIDSLATERLADLMDKQRRKGRLDLANADWRSEQVETWWADGERPLAEAQSLDELVGWLLVGLTAGSLVNLGIFRRRTKAIERSLRRLRTTLAVHRQLDLRAAFGSLPPVGLSRERGLRQAFLLVEEPLQSKQEIPSMGIEYGQLQHAGLLASFDVLRKGRQRVCAFRLRSMDTESWLRAVERVAEG